MRYLLSPIIDFLQMLLHFFHSNQPFFTGWGVPLICLAGACSIIMLPFERWVAIIAEREKAVQDILQPQLARIKRVKRGSERHKQIRNLYTRYAYHPFYAVRSVVGLLIQLPFLLATYYLLRNFTYFQGAEITILGIADLSKPDGIINGINALPFLMLVINILVAFTTIGLGKRGRLQAIGVGILFTIVLYNMPSGLVIYWTASQFFNLIKQIFNRLSEGRFLKINYFSIFLTPLNVVAGIVGKFVSFWRVNVKRSLRNRLLTSGIVAFFVASLLVYFGPLVIYLTNPLEFEFDFILLSTNLLFPLLLYFLGLFIALSLLPEKLQLHKIITSAVFISGSLIFIHSYVFVWNYGVFNGQTTEWEMYKTREIIDGLLWAFGLILVIFRNKWLYRNATKISVVFLAFQVIYVGYLVHKNEAYSVNAPTYKATSAGQFSFSTKKNVFIIIFDTVEAQLFEELIENNPRYKEQLDGFYYFPDATTTFPTTIVAVTNILTGKIYKNEIPIDQFRKEAFLSDSSLPKLLKDQKYHVWLPNRSIFISPEVCSNISLYKFSLDDNLINFSLFRQFPQFLKRALSDRLHSLSLKSYLPLFSQLKNDKNMHNYKTLDFRKVNYPEDFTKYSDRENFMLKYQFEYFFDSKLPLPSFKYYHILGAHPTIKGSTKAPNRLGQLESCFDFLFSVIKIFKNSDIYENSLIIVGTDHGPHIATSATVNNFNGFLLIKPFAKRGALEMVSKSVAYTDLSTLIYKYVTNSYDSFDRAIAALPDYKKRYFYHYHWLDSWERMYLNNIREYEVTGNVRDGDITFTGNVYRPNEREVIGSVKFNETIDLRISESKKYLFGDWNFSSIKGVIRGNGRRASLIIPLDEPLNFDFYNYTFRIRYSLNDKKELSLNFNGKWGNCLKPTTDFYLSKKIIDIPSTLNQEQQLYIQIDKPSTGNLVVNSIEIIRKTIPNYSIGDNLLFAGQKPDVTSMNGWCNPENWGTWSCNATESKITVRLDMMPEKPLSLKFLANAFVVKNKHPLQRVDIFINGVLVEKLSITQNDAKQYNIAIPSHLINPIDPLIEIKFSFKDAQSPKALGLSGDSRMLSIGIMELQIDI